MNASAIISELHVACFGVPFCRMIAMHVVCPTLKIYNLKLQGKFFSAYEDEVTIFYLSVTNEASLS